jgi:D-xylose transport system substrate-binding protein
MRKSSVPVVAMGVVAAFALAACSSSGGGSKSSTPAGGSSGASSPAASSGSSSSGAAGGSVGVILPDTTSSTRYTLYDAPLLKKAFDAAGIKNDVQNAGGSTAKASQIADAMIGEGVKVLVLDSIDATSGAAIEAKAQAAGIKVIDYDRVNLGGTAPYYVSFDNELVGKLQAQTLVQCLQAKKVNNPQIIEMDGGKDVDNNAVLFAKGAGEVLSPLQSAGKLKVVSKTTVKGWDKNLAAPAFTQALTANGGKVDGVLAANDDIANEVITVLKNKGLQVPVTGQDAGISGLQNILKGDQCMTVFKDVKKEAAAASQLAIALIKGTDPAAGGLTLKKFDDPKSSSHNIQAVLLTPQVITNKNVQDVVTAGSLTAADICKGIESLCTKYGVK